MGDGWVGGSNHPSSRPVPTQNSTTQQTRTYNMPRAGFELTISIFKRSDT